MYGIDHFYFNVLFVSYLLCFVMCGITCINYYMNSKDKKYNKDSYKRMRPLKILSNIIIFLISLAIIIPKIWYETIHLKQEAHIIIYADIIQYTFIFIDFVIDYEYYYCYLIVFINIINEMMLFYFYYQNDVYFLVLLDILFLSTLNFYWLLKLIFYHE